MKKETNKLNFDTFCLNIINIIYVGDKNIAAVPLTATAVNRSFVFKNIKAKPNIEKINITNLPLKILFFNKPRSETINLEQLDKVESMVDIAEIINKKNIMYEDVLPKYIEIASINEMLSREYPDRKIPINENNKIRIELKKKE